MEMRLVYDQPEEIHTIRLAAELTVNYGFCAMYVSEDGRAAIIPASEVVALTKKCQQDIAKKIEELRKRK
jgi:hypothetical protein